MGYKKDKTPYPHELRERNQRIYDLVKLGLSGPAVAKMEQQGGKPLSRQRISIICKEVARLNELE